MRNKNWWQKLLEWLLGPKPPVNNPPNQPDQPNQPGGDNMKVALCTGINAYNPPISGLQGCVNDAKAFCNILKSKGFAVTLLLDKEVTKQRVLNELRQLLGSVKDGGVFVWTNSSHGSQVRDANGDEPDGQDEVIVTAEGKFITDDEIRVIFDEAAARGISIQLVSDSCFSGTLTRMLDIEGAHPDMDETAIPRWVSPGLLGKEIVTSSLPVRSMFRGIGEENMPEVLLSGCTDREYSYDAVIDGVPMGAMSCYATRAINANPSATWAEIYAIVRKSLPSSQYPQTPQLEGKTANKGKEIFT